VTYRIDDDVDYEPRRESRRVPWLSIVVVVGLATIGVTSAVLWRTYGNVLPGFPTSSSVNGPTVQSVDKVDGLRELQALQQQSAGQMQTVVQLLTSQQAEIKKLSEQMTALTGKVDTLQHSVTAAQPIPAPAVPKPVAPRKKPARSNPIVANPTGAPLPAPVQIAPPPPNRP
jgi:uncharacterized coiled-coil protein SlyX